MFRQALENCLPAIEAALADTVEQERLPGLAFGIVIDQELASFGGFGTRDLASGESADENTLHRVASITKTLTTTAILQQRDSGKLSLDDPLTVHLPEFSGVRVLAGHLEDVTLRRLLTHRSGLVTETPLPTWSTSEFPDLEAILGALPETEIVIPQDSAFKYSNLAFGLLGEVIARTSGQPYFEYMHDHVLGPLGMDSSVFELTDPLRERMAVGYSPNLFRDDLQPAPYVLLGGVAACGQLHSSVADLARWISFQFRTGETDDVPGVLSSRTLDEFHRPQYIEDDWSAGQCLGWRTLRVGDHVYHGHGGGIFGFSSHILFSKPHRIGAICLANLWPYPMIQSITVQILERLLGNPDPPPLVPPALTDQQRPQGQPRAQTDDPGFSTHAGLYVAEPGVPVQIEWRNGQLQMVVSPLWPYPLHSGGILETTDDPSAFRVRGGRGAGELAVFALDEDGDPAGFSLGGFVYRRVMA